MGAALSKLHRAPRTRSSVQGLRSAPPLDNNTHTHTLPPELWRIILAYLYPSQLTQLALVNRHFYFIVTTLRLWPAIYTKAFPCNPLPLLPSICPSTSYALFVAANSLHICELCFCKCNTITTDPSTDGLTRTDHPNDYGTTSSGSGSSNDNSARSNSSNCAMQDPMGTASWPLPVFLPWANAMIRLCLVCRRKHFYCFPEPIPRSLVGKQWRKKQIRTRFHLRNEEIEQLKRFGCGLGGSFFCVVDALVTARIIYGGDVGIDAVDRSPAEWIDRSISRVDLYQKRWETQSAGASRDVIASLSP